MVPFSLILLNDIKNAMSRTRFFHLACLLIKITSWRNVNRTGDITFPMCSDTL